MIFFEKRKTIASLSANKCGSRLPIVAGDKRRLYVIYRDFERGGGISPAASSGPYYRDWDIADIYPDSIEMWEPTHDTHAWNGYGELHLVVKKVRQAGGETLEEVEPQPCFDP